MEPFIGEIRMFGGNFAPRSWAFCDGQLLAVSSNDALFSLLGTIYGGDGRTTFGLPDLRGRVPIHAGNGPGLTPRNLGSKSGLEAVSLPAIQLSPHTHPSAATVTADSESPAGAHLAVTDADAYGLSGSGVTMATATTATGQGQPHNNLAPFQCVNFIIALQGVYPSRS